LDAIENERLTRSADRDPEADCRDRGGEYGKLKCARPTAKIIKCHWRRKSRQVR